MDIDLTKDTGEVERIIFDAIECCGIQTYLSPSCDEYFKVKTTLSDKEDAYFIRYESIDNLIKALKKAKELWT